MAGKSISIIGAGIAGLSAGCYGQMNGYDTQVFEMHTKPGGLCTSWKRGDYVFDGCLHWLVGSGTGSSTRRLWDELGALQGCRIVDHDVFLRVEGSGGRTLVVYTDVDRLEGHMKDLAPGDVAVIEEMCNAVRSVGVLDIPLDVPGQAPAEAAPDPNLLAFLEVMGKYGVVPLPAFAQRFSDPFLRWALPKVFDLPDMPTSGCLMTLAWMHRRDAGYPVGGSLEFSRNIERRYVGLGGRVHYKSRVEEILVEGDRAVGVRLADGTEQRSDLVISAADGHATIFDMLKGRYADDTVRGYYDELPLFPPLLQVSLGVARDLSSEPHSVIFALDEPVAIGGKTHDTLGVKHYCYDPTVAPAGKSVVVVLLTSDYRYWKSLHRDRERYEAEKEKVADTVLALVDRRFPDIRDDVEVVDVATPITYERYTNNWRASFEGWLLSTKTMGMAMSGGMSKTLPGLDKFYMAGQWVEPGGGVPTAAMSGRTVIRMVCERDGRAFETFLP